MLLLLGQTGCGSASPEEISSIAGQILEVVEIVESVAAEVEEVSEEHPKSEEQILEETLSEEMTSEEAVSEETESTVKTSGDPELPDWLPEEGEYYYDVENVVLYLYLYEELPDNYITKSEARKLGWEGGSVEKYQGGAAIGGDRFGNREGLLPEAEGRDYTECDIDTLGAKSRGAKRIVFSDDGLIYYTDDHYESFELLYGEP
jgi:hypothetical protein